MDMFTNITLDTCNLAIRTALSGDHAIATTTPKDVDAMASTATEKWEDNLGRLETKNAANAKAAAEAKARQDAANAAVVANGKKVRQVCRELGGSEDVRVIRDYIQSRNACDEASGHRRQFHYKRVVVGISARKDYARNRGKLPAQLVVTQQGIRLLWRADIGDMACRPTWFERRATEVFDPEQIKIAVREAADAIRRGEEPDRVGRARIGGWFS